MKKYLICLLLLVNPAFALTYDSVDLPMPYFSRFGTGNTPEIIYEQLKAKDQKVVKAVDKTAEELNLKDLDIKYLSNEIVDEMNLDSPKILSDLSILYNGAVQRSETIKYAIYKLSNPDEDKPDENAVKKILKPIASFSSIAGTALSDNPYMAAGALIGGSLVGAVTGDDRAVNYKFSKVDDADMVVLVRKIDELQKKLLFLYMDYISNKGLYEMALTNLEKRKIMYDEMQNNGSREELIVADLYYRNAQELVVKAKSKYELSRRILENLTGEQSLAEIEKANK